MARPLVAFGAMTTILLTTVQVTGNQFGFDRSGFRAYVLAPVPRRDILLGKNLAVAPITGTICIVAVCFVQILFPMRLDRFAVGLETSRCHALRDPSGQFVRL